MQEVGELHYTDNGFRHATCFSAAFEKADNTFSHFHKAENRRKKIFVTQKYHTHDIPCIYIHKPTLKMCL